jgi:hypothetical protein
MQGDQWIVECDFSAADLRDVRFYQTPVETLLLPAWPYITAVARDGETVFAPPSSQRPALTSLLNAVFDFPWEDLPMKRAMESIVFGVGIRTNEASVQVSHAEDIVKRGAGSLERLRTALDRLAHPAIRY